MDKWDKISLIVGAIETILIGIAGIVAQKQIIDSLRKLDLLTENEKDVDMDKLQAYCKRAITKDTE